MGTLRLETVLVGHEIDGVCLAVRSHPTDGSPDRYGLVFLPGILDDALLCAGGAVAQLVAELISIEVNIGLVLLDLHFVLRTGSGQRQEHCQRAND